MVRKRSLWAAVLAMAALAACAARQPGAPIEPGFNLFSKEQDVQIGREAAAQVRQQFDVVDNQRLQDYVQRIGRRLASQQEAGGFPYEFTLLNAKEINAFALPGGPTFFFSGLLLAAENEGQLAGVMAHEIAHVALRHGTNQVSKANLLQIPAAIAGAALGQGALGQVLQLGLGVGLNGLFLRYSREAENQADALGTHIMAGAGYNPIEMARFFEKLQGQGGPGVPQFLSDHPNPGNRIKAVQAEIRTLPQRSYGFRAGNFEEMAALAKQLPPPKRQPKRSANPAHEEVAAGN